VVNNNNNNNNNNNTVYVTKAPSHPARQIIFGKPRQVYFKF
jgi:hypothetical protein